MFDDDYRPKTKFDKFFEQVLPWFFFLGILVLCVAAIYLTVHVLDAVLVGWRLTHA